ncbi:MAG: two-CW domain-containing protein [Nitrospirota bacterium]
MPSKQNCWEYNKCGREPGGINAGKMGICPTTTDESANGLNEGTNGGRICWAIAGTLGLKVKRTPARNLVSCLVCDFFKLVKKEEGEEFRISKGN